MMGVGAWRPAATPNATITPDVRMAIWIGWIVLALVGWTLARPAIFPDPWEVLQALPGLWASEGLGQALTTSFTVNIQAIVLSTLIALPVAYVSRVPVFEPLVRVLSQLRFLSPAVFFLVLLFMLGSGRGVKIGMLVLGETFFLVTTMANAVQGIPESAFDDARVLRMSEWTATWYVAVRGTLAQALEAVRDNAAIGWSMLMMVEGVIRSEGGLGVLLLNQERYMRFEAVYGIALVVLVVGLTQDFLLRELRTALCPHTKL